MPDLHDTAQAEHGRYYCRRCVDREVIASACQRYSMGVYAGMLCDACWRDDSRNHTRSLDPADAGERLDPEDP